ncbi:response regulator [Candidatus Kaiserbacteria bacterium]|nr:response regulator [Candidatus Kaiserbacteria bacterium]
MADTKKIMLVEDDGFMLDILANKLTKSGFEVHVAQDGEACLNALDSFKPDLVLLDIIMPQIDGFEVLRRIKDSSVWRATPVIVLTNLGEQKEVQHAMDLGAKGYIVKANVTTKEIVEKINNTFGIHTES